MPGEEFDARRLTLARWAAGMTKQELADSIGASASSISQYEAENTAPRAATLHRMALALGVPIEYFKTTSGRRSPRLEARSYFRSLRSTRQWQRDQADAIAEHLYDLVEFIDTRLRLPDVELPSFPISPDRPSLAEIDDAATAVRQAWDLPNGPVSNVVRLLEVHGVVVARMQGVGERVDAFSRWFEKRPVVLLSAQKQDKGRSRFDAAHELGHLVLHSEPEPGNRALERQAHAFAAGFLMPKEQIFGELPSRITRPEHWDELFAVRSRWGVSAAALLYRSRELEVLSDSSFRRAMTQLSKMGLRKHDGEMLGEPERPELLARAVASLEKAFDLTVTELTNQLRFSERQMTQILGDVGNRGQGSHSKPGPPVGRRKVVAHRF